VSTEARGRTKVGHWKILSEKARPLPMMRKPEDLLEERALPKV
jgi:hypothetical protein